MSGLNSRGLQPLMELDLTPPEGYPKLPKWDSTLNYRLKDPSLFDAFENPFHISSDVSDSESSENINFSNRRRLAQLLPKSAPPPPHRVEEPRKQSTSQSRSQTKSAKCSRMRIADREIPIRYATMSESSDTTESIASVVSSNSGNSLSYVDKYLELKRRKALFLKKVREDHDYTLESSINFDDPDILNETDFFLEENVIKRETDFENGFPNDKSNSIKETSFINSNIRPTDKDSNLSNNSGYGHERPLSTTEKNSTSKTGDLNVLTDQMNECYI